MTIHKEGIRILLTTLVVLVLFNTALYFVVPDSSAITVSITASALFFILILQFFRSPQRFVDQDNGMVLAPADGKVVVIEQTTESEFYHEERIQVSIFMSPTNVHVNWSPISGIVKYFKYHQGKYLVAWHPKSSEENERTTVVIENERFSVLVRQIAGAVARRIVSYAQVNNTLKQGQEIGFIKFGSRVDVFLPLDADIKVALNQKVKGNRTILASVGQK